MTSSGADLLKQLDSSREELLDLSKRNKLISTPRHSRAKRLDIVDEDAIETFSKLVVQEKKLYFRFDEKAEAAETQNGRVLEEDPTVSLDQPEEDVSGKTGGGKEFLQTPVSSKKLQNRLLQLYRESISSQEETGTNTLYLAIGFLKWYEDDRSDKERWAPLVLVPVELNRSTAASPFQVVYSGEDIQTNLSLQLMLKNDFGVRFPDIPESIDDWEIEDYFSEIARSIEEIARWEVVRNDMMLAFFYFTKMLMYRDLDPESWTEGTAIDQHPVLQQVLGNERFSEPAPMFDDHCNLDEAIEIDKQVHVLDADSSQTIAIEEVRRGRNLVIQGPPGTGKSQTIANLIASAVAEGKTVLFVAEKMAALQVVHKRLKNLGLGEICLELHSNKATKKEVLEDLKKTKNLHPPKLDDLDYHQALLEEKRRHLNQYCRELHDPVEPSGITPFEAFGESIRLRALEIGIPLFSIAGMNVWNPEQYRQRRDAIKKMEQILQQIGNPPEHPWRGLERDFIQPLERDRMIARIPQLLPRIKQIEQANQHLGEVLQIDPAVTPQETSQLALIAKHRVESPGMDFSCLKHAVWKEKRLAIEKLIQNGKRYEAQRSKLLSILSEEHLDHPEELEPLMTVLQQTGNKWYRWFLPSYRRAFRKWKRLLENASSDAPFAPTEVVESVSRLRKLKKRLVLQEAAELGQAAFGIQWKEHRSDWEFLESILQWESKLRRRNPSGDLLDKLIAVQDPKKMQPAIETLVQNLKAVHKEINELCKEYSIRCKEAFGQSELARVPWQTLHERLVQWQQRPEEMHDWCRYYQAFITLIQNGMEEVARQVHAGGLERAPLLHWFELLYYNQVIEQAAKDRHVLRNFCGETYCEVRKKFFELDQQQIELARQRVAQKHYQRIPRNDFGAGEVGILEHEFQKKRAHKPIRKLLIEAGRAVQSIKPVFMMSPLSVSKYLAPDNLEFDLLLIDEASQVRPAEALGALARAKQVVVVGDDKQLPPTTFFGRGLDSDESEEEDFEARTRDLESILGLCCASGIPQRMLRWHYRSQHHSLIAVSNREFYNNDLFVVPSPSDVSFDMGLRFQHVSEGIYEPGNSINRQEAIQVADAVIQHATERSEESLGVGTFSVKQRDAVLDELEIRRRERPELEAFFSREKEEPFFVKNLENIQGDERDVILISVGYGPDVHGKFRMSFGPLNNDGGHRRLNVLITRSRKRCEVYCSFQPDQLDLSRTKARGIAALKTFLEYAKTGEFPEASLSDRDCDSEFERQVMRVLTSHGYRVTPQIGVAGFFIDLAVADPQRPGNFVLGIECDGASYHSSRNARDRDRLRQSILEARGWTIHRIWSTDWFHQTESETKKIIEVVEEAIARADRQEDEEKEPDPNEQPPEQQVIRPAARLVRAPATADEQEKQEYSVPYRKAEFTLYHLDPIDHASSQELVSAVEAIVKIEGPIHRDEVAQRVRELAGLGRTTKKVKEVIHKALRKATQLGKLSTADRKFYLVADHDGEVQIRDRSDAGNTLRKPEHLPPSEIRAGIRTVVSSALGITQDSLVDQTLRLFGFQRASSKLKMAIRREIVSMIGEKAIEKNGDRLSMISSR